MSYIPFGRRQVAAAVDNGFNPFNNKGNFTAIFAPDQLSLPQGQFEIQKASISGGLPGDTFSVFLDTYQLDGGVLNSVGAATFYKASDGEFIIAGGSNTGYLYFYFGASNLTFAPGQFLVTLWLCFDPNLAINQSVFGPEATRGMYA